MKIVFSVYTFCVFLIIACTTNFEPVKHSENNSNKEKIVGTWIWTRTTGGIQGIDITPQSTGNTAKIIIDKTLVKSYFNDSLLYSLNYSLDSVLATYNSSDSIPVLHIGDEYVYKYLFPTANSLVLSDIFIDGFVHEYIRKF